jgi:hypothetical protein
VRVRRTVAQDAIPEDIRDGSQSHWRPGVSTVGLLHGIDGQGAYGIDA